jgi:uncharacterized protein YndB with AHSA1/START domain
VNSTTSKHQTSITLDERVPLVRITREFDAPADQVFRAHTDSDLVVRWLGPEKAAMRIETWDCRTGGAYRWVDESDPGTPQWFHGSFHDVLPEQRVVVQTFTWEGMPDSVTLERLVVTDLGDGRSRLESTSLVDSFEARDAFVASGMEHGVVEGYEKLDRLLGA